ncbi:hypothetical protein NQZ68_031476, partial [Dissostichus eleginoides]
MAIPAEESRRTPPTVQTQAEPESQEPNQQRVGGGFRGRQSGRGRGSYRTTGRGSQ